MTHDASRRNFLFGALGVAAAGAGVTLVRFAYPRFTGDPQVFVVAPADIPAPGVPPFEHHAGRFFLINLPRDDETAVFARGGLLALSNACTHLKCSVAWLPRFDAAEEFGVGVDEGSFLCRCHGGRFRRDGSRLFGPPPRGLDAFRTLADGRNVRVDTHAVARAPVAGPARAPLPWPPPS